MSQAYQFGIWTEPLTSTDSRKWKSKNNRLFFSNVQHTDNIVLQTLMCVPMVKYEMLELEAKYGLSDVRYRLSTIRDTVWSYLVQG